MVQFGVFEYDSISKKILLLVLLIYLAHVAVPGAALLNIEKKTS